VFGMVMPLFAKIKSKQIAGTWNYEITMSDGSMNGSFIFTQKNGKLQGECVQSDGPKYLLSKMKVNNKNETLCFEVLRENDDPIEFILILDHEKFKGKGWINEANFEITSKKITIENNLNSKL
jgi:hypothetical protein